MPGWAAGRARILLIGPTGAGKSALVNAILGEGTAASAAGAPVTKGMRWYAGDTPLPFALGDTRGLEAATSPDQVAELRRWLAALPPAHRPHLVWMVINAEGARAFSGEGTLAALADALRDAAIPHVVVLTHAEPGPASHGALRARIASVMGEAPLVAVNTRPLLGEDGEPLLPVHGLDALWAASRSFLPAPA